MRPAIARTDCYAYPHSKIWHRTPSSLTLTHPVPDRENRVALTEQVSVACRSNVHAINSSPCSYHRRRTEETSRPSFVWYGAAGSEDSSPVEAEGARDRYVHEFGTKDWQRDLGLVAQPVKSIANATILLRITMRLSDARLRRRQTKLVYPNHRPLLGSSKT
jgi:hypothetical protein